MIDEIKANIRIKNSKNFDQVVVEISGHRRIREAIGYVISTKSDDNITLDVSILHSKSANGKYNRCIIVYTDNLVSIKRIIYTIKRYFTENLYNLEVDDDVTLCSVK